MNEEMFRHSIKLIAEQMIIAANKAGLQDADKEERVREFMANMDTDEFYKHFDITSVQSGDALAFKAVPKTVLANLLSRVLGDCLEEYKKRTGDDDIQVQIIKGTNRL